MCEQFRDFMGVLYTYISDVTLFARYQINTDMFNWTPCMKFKVKYSVMQSDHNSFCDDFVLDSFKVQNLKF